MEIYNLSNTVLSLFSQGNWKRAIALYASEREEKANRQLITAEPTNSCGIAKLQEEIKQLRLLSCIENAVIKFEENEALQKITTK